MSGSHMNKYRKRRINNFLLSFASGSLFGAFFVLLMIGMMKT